MQAKINQILIKFITLTSLYNCALGVWSGTIYLFMRHLNYSYADINMFLAIFWIVTFFAELPSGILADSFGKINVFILSCIIRSVGLLFLYFDNGIIYFLLISGVLTALGDSLYSGTLDSWFVDKAKSIDENYKLNRAFSLTTTISTAASLISGFVGAQFIANINIGYPILVGAILLLLPIPIAYNESKYEKKHPVTLKNLKNAITIDSEKWRKIKTVMKNNQKFIWMSLAFLPIVLIVTGPYNQWQLFFQNGTKRIETGWILIGVNLLGMLGSYISGSLLKIKKTFALLIGLSFINTITIVISANLSFKLVAAFMFLIHVLFTSADEVVRYTLLHEQVVGKNRTTLISLNNTFNAGFTIIVLGLNGWLSDAFSIGFSWTILALGGFILTLIGYVLLAIKFRKVSN